jgi:diacylglycerol kinase (ATP)
MTLTTISNTFVGMKNASFKSRFAFALNGIVSTFKGESSFRIQVVAGVFVLTLLLILKAAAFWWALISLVIGSVLGAELMNTAMEHLLDHLHPEQHNAVKLAKDCAAGAVLILSICSVAILCCFLCEKFALISWH